VLFVVKLELLLQLFIQVCLELITILEGVKSVVEDTKDLVGPELNDLFFSLIEVLVGLIDALEHFRNITHVEHIVTLGRSRQEVQLDDIEQVNGSQSHSLTLNLDFFVEDLEFKGGNCLENSFHLRLSWDCVVHNVELGLQALRDLRSTTTRLTHSC